MVVNSIGNDVEFKVFADKGVIVCRLLDCEEIAISRIFKYVKISCIFNYDKYLINDVYTGVAKCSPEDTFNEEYGKKLALSRAKKKRGKAINKALKKFYIDMRRDLLNLKSHGIHEVPAEEE